MNYLHSEYERERQELLNEWNRLCAEEKDLEAQLKAIKLDKEVTRQEAVAYSLILD